MLEQLRLWKLKKHTYTLPQYPQVCTFSCDIYAINDHCASSRLEQAIEMLYQCRFARTRYTNNGDTASSFNLHIDVNQSSLLNRPRLIGMIEMFRDNDRIHQCASSLAIASTVNASAEIA